MTIAATIAKISADARAASHAMARLPTTDKNDLLMNMAKALIKNAPHLIEENRRDLEAGEKKGLSAAMLDRLMLDKSRVKGMAEGLREVAALPDPVHGLKVGERDDLDDLSPVVHAQGSVVVDHLLVHGVGEDLVEGRGVDGGLEPMGVLNPAGDSGVAGDGDIGLLDRMLVVFALEKITQEGRRVLRVASQNRGAHAHVVCARSCRRHCRGLKVHNLIVRYRVSLCLERLDGRLEVRPLRFQRGQKLLFKHCSLLVVRAFYGRDRV